MEDTFNYQYSWIGNVVGILVAWTVCALSPGLTLALFILTQCLPLQSPLRLGA